MDRDDKNEYLLEIGKLLFGERWQTELTRVINVSDRTVRRWAAGNSEIPDGVIRELLSIMHDRADLLTRRSAIIASQVRDEPGYQRVIYLPSLSVADLRIDLDSASRDWFDIDGKLYATHSDGTVIDIRGNTVELPAEITTATLQAEKQAQIMSANTYE